MAKFIVIVLSDNPAPHSETVISLSVANIDPSLDSAEGAIVSHDAAISCYGRGLSRPMAVDTPACLSLICINTRTMLWQGNRTMPLYISIDTECAGSCFPFIIEAVDMATLTC